LDGDGRRRIIGEKGTVIYVGTGDSNIFLHASMMKAV